MKKSLFNYSDWYSGKVYLETCASVIPKKILATHTKVNSTQFSTYNFKKIQSKQKEIFNKSSTDLLKKFKKTFNERYKKSGTKVLFLKREIDDNRKILLKKPIQDIKFLNRNFSISAIDLESMRDFIETQIIKGDEYFGFVHSPKFKYPNEKFTNDLVYAKVTFHYYNWLMKFYNNLKRSLAVVKEKKNEIIDKKKVRVKVKVIALIYFYNGNQINRKNCQEIASLYGYNEINSGEGLFQDYTKFIKINYRSKTNDESKIKCNYRLSLIKIAISHLKGKEKENAEKDYKILENAINDHDWRF